MFTILSRIPDILLFKKLIVLADFIPITTYWLRVWHKIIILVDASLRFGHQRSSCLSEVMSDSPHILSAD